MVPILQSGIILYMWKNMYIWLDIRVSVTEEQSGAEMIQQSVHHH